MTLNLMVFLQAVIKDQLLFVYFLLPAQKSSSQQIPISLYNSFDPPPPLLRLPLLKLERYPPILAIWSRLICLAKFFPLWEFFFILLVHDTPQFTWMPREKREYDRVHTRHSISANDCGLNGFFGIFSSLSTAPQVGPVSLRFIPVGRSWR